MDVAQAETGKARSAAQEEIVDMILNANYYAREAARLLSTRSGCRVCCPGSSRPWSTTTPRASSASSHRGIIPMTLSISDSIPALLRRQRRGGQASTARPRTARWPMPNCCIRPGCRAICSRSCPGRARWSAPRSSRHCDYMMFTGSTATGRTLAEQCGRRLIGFSAELGGKNPMIVTKGANLKVAAKAATRACFSNAGQLCISIERIYVERAGGRRVHRQVRRAGPQHEPVGGLRLHRRHGQPDLRRSDQDRVRPRRRCKGQGRQGGCRR